MGQIGGLSPEGSIALGILVGLVSTSVQSLGLTLQRKSHILEDEKEVGELRRPPYRRRRWQLGMAMFIISNLAGSTIQITTLPLPVLSTLQASGLVFNTLCASLILGEPFTSWSVGGTILVCAGAVLIAIFGAIGEPAHSLDQLLDLLVRRQFVLWMVGTAIIVVATIASAKAIKYMTRWSAHSPRVRLFRGLAYGAVSGILSAHSLLVAKSAVELLVRTIVDHKNQFDRWQSWIILLALLFLALSQLYYLHRGLRLCSTSVLYPFVFCVYNIIAILDGLIYFHEASRITLLHGLIIALGTVVLLAGVLALSWRLNNDPTPRAPVPQTPLTPGLGFVGEGEENMVDEVESHVLDDEEIASKETSPLLHNRSRSTSSPFATPASRRSSGLLHISRTRRRPTKGISEDIWDELQDADPAPLDSAVSGAPGAGGSKSPFRARFAPSPPSARHRTRSLSATIKFDSSTRSPAARDSQKHQGFEDEATPGEDTPLLLQRASTGRSYRDTRRRQSMPVTSFLQEGSQRRRTTTSGSQDALGGWWKMGWWSGKDGGEDGKRRTSSTRKGKERAAANGQRNRDVSRENGIGNGHDNGVDDEDGDEERTGGTRPGQT